MDDDRDRARQVVEALKLLAEEGANRAAEIEHKLRGNGHWIESSGGAFAADVYLDAGEAVELALALLGFARRRRKL